MAKVKTGIAKADGAVKNELVIKYDINVTTKGVFTTTLPGESVDKLVELGVDLKKNNRYGSKLGYFEAPTMAELEDKVQQLCADAVTREMVSEKLVILYDVKTRVNYVKKTDGSVHPNGYVGGEQGKDWFWKEGNDTIASYDNKPFGMSICVKPHIQRVYKYRSGKEKVELTPIDRSPEDCADHLKPGPNLLWLNRLCNMGSGGYGANLQTVDYSEEVAGFFVRFVKMIMEFSDKIKDFLDPDSIEQIARSSMPMMLGAADEVSVKPTVVITDPEQNT